MGIGPDVGHGEQSLVAFRSAVTGIAILLEQRCTASCRFVVDLEWIFWRRDFLRKIRLPFHIGENQISVLSVHGSAEPERGEEIACNRRFGVAVPMDPGAFTDIPNQTELDR